MVDTLSGVLAHNARQALVRIPMAGEELDHDVGVTYRSETYSRKIEKKINKWNIIEINSIISCAEKRWIVNKKTVVKNIAITTVPRGKFVKFYNLVNIYTTQ